MATKKVVIVGGGFAGRSALRYLRRHKDKDDTDDIEITLIDKKEYFEFIPSILNTILNPNGIANITYAQQSQSDFTFIQGTVIQFELNDNTIILSSSINVPFDYCIWAIGTCYTYPIHNENDVYIHQRVNTIQQYGQCVMNACEIHVIGGGPVGVELAAELTYLISPAAKLKLYTTKRGILPKLSHRARKYAKKKLEKLGVDIIISQDNESQNNESTSSTLLRIDCTGSKPQQPDLMTNLQEITKSLQSKRNRRVFVAGDVLRNYENSAMIAISSGTLAARNIIHAIKQETLKNFPDDAFVFCKNPKLMIISLGKRDAIFIAGKHIFTGRIALYLKYLIETIQIHSTFGTYVIFDYIAAILSLFGEMLVNLIN